MGYAILWISGLAAAVLLVALDAAFSARLARWWQRILGATIAAMPGLFVGVLASIIGGVLLVKGIRHHWFYYSLSWLIGFSAGAVVIALRALTSREGESVPRGRSWPAGRIAIGLGAAVAVFAAVLLYMNAAASVELTKLHAEALEQMRAAMPPRVPDHRNAALVYDQAFEAMGNYKSWRGKDWFRQIDSPAFDATSPEIKGFLRAKAPAAALLRKAAAMPDYYFEADYTRGPAMRIPKLMKWRSAANLLALSARGRADRGDMRGALEDVAAIRRMAAHLSGAPTLISQMISVAIDAAATNAAERALAAGPTKAEDVGALPVDVPASASHASFVRAWKVEEATMVLTLTGSGEMSFTLPFGGVDLKPGGLTGAVWRVFFLPYEIAAYRRWLGRMRNISRLPYNEMHEKAKNLGSDLADGAGGILASIATPNMSASYMATAEVEARQRLAYLGLAATAYRAQKGGYPRELSELVPRYIEAIPTDPFSGGHLKMLAIEGGLVLYSVGRNGKDDGGKDDAWWWGTDVEGDLTFCLGSAYEERRLKPAREAAKRRKRVKAR